MLKYGIVVIIALSTIAHFTSIEATILGAITYLILRDIQKEKTMNFLKDLSEEELKNKIEELNDSFLSYAYVKELEQRQEPETEQDDA